MESVKNGQAKYSHGETQSQRTTQKEQLSRQLIVTTERFKSGPEILTERRYLKANEYRRLFRAPVFRVDSAEEVLA